VREVAEAARADIRTAISPVPLYPFKRISPPVFHAQLYAGSEAPGRPALGPERNAVIYANVWGAREEDVNDVAQKIEDVLVNYRTPANGRAKAIMCNLASRTLLEEDDGTLHIALLFTANYHRI
jgi:hypothetical protein